MPLQSSGGAFFTMFMVKRASAELCQSTFFTMFMVKRASAEICRGMFYDERGKMIQKSSAEELFTMNMVKSALAEPCRGTFYHEHGKTECSGRALQKHFLP